MEYYSTNDKFIYIVHESNLLLWGLWNFNQESDRPTISQFYSFGVCVRLIMFQDTASVSYDPAPANGMNTIQL
jgi:hypothetical protein